jgi:hypothetical protein
VGADGESGVEGALVVPMGENTVYHLAKSYGIEGNWLARAEEGLRGALTGEVRPMTKCV